VAATAAHELLAQKERCKPKPAASEASLKAVAN
jgi:hypothetical protein